MSERIARKSVKKWGEVIHGNEYKNGYVPSDGFSLAYYVKAISPETPVVMLVGRNKQDPPDKKEGCCFDDLLFKPFGFKDIQYTIQKFFGTGSDQKDMVSLENETCGVRLCG